VTHWLLSHGAGIDFAVRCAVAVVALLEIGRLVLAERRRASEGAWDDDSQAGG
jgi:hypothetical protein